MTTDILKAKFETINKKCESTIKLKLDKLYTGISYDNLKSCSPSPQVIEALWFELITRKEHEFVKEIALVLNKSDATLNKENAGTIERIINDTFDEVQYLGRMRDFYKETDKKVALNESPFDPTTNSLDLIDSTYQKGVIKVLFKARNNVLAELELHKKSGPEGLGFLAQWRQYSNLSPLRAIGTIILLSCTSSLIAWVIASKIFQQFLERFGWSGGSGL